MYNQDESGRSMIEMLGVLSIMGVIMYGAVAGINFGIDMYKINATYNEIEELGQAITDLYSWNSGNYDGLTKYTDTSGNYSSSAQIICDNDAYPNCTNNNTQLTNQWGGGVNVGSVGTEAEDFVIEYTGLPYVACERLRTEPSFQSVCIGKNIDCASGNTNIVTFYSIGATKCK